ncbi:hypothetical protein Hanom_Chr09g00844411 [Helianthus anomalus]
MPICVDLQDWFMVCVDMWTLHLTLYFTGTCALSVSDGKSLIQVRASRRKAIEDVKAHLEGDQESHLFISTSYVKPVFKFLKEADRKGDSVAKRHGAELLLSFDVLERIQVIVI